MSNQLSKLIPTLIMILFYFLSFWFLSLSLKHLSAAFAYSIWSAFGMILIGLIGSMFFNQRIDIPFIIGTSIIIVGVIFICIFSNTISH